MNGKLILLHIAKASDRDFTIQERRDRRWIAVWLFLGGAMTVFTWAGVM